MRKILDESPSGFVFAYAATAMTRRGGSAVAGEVLAALERRGAGWERFAVGALAMHPEPRFDAVFKTLLTSVTTMRQPSRAADSGCRAATPLKNGRPTSSHKRWRPAIRNETPEVVLGAR